MIAGGRFASTLAASLALSGDHWLLRPPRRTRLCVARVARQRAAKCIDDGPPLVDDDARGSAKNHSCHGRLHALDNFPHLKTLIVEKRDEFEQQYGPDAVTISVFTGDFLMPYLLSAIDKGRGMMKMLNRTPVDYLIWGNHEDNLSPADVFAREREYEGTWLNTNMPTHETMAEGSKCQATHAWLNVGAKRIAMLGVTSHTSPKPGAFNGAQILDPWATLAEWAPRSC